MKTLKKIALVVVMLALAFGAMCLEAWIGMLLLNWVLGLFNCAFTLTFWQSFGVCVLLIFVGRFFKSNSKEK